MEWRRNTLFGHILSSPAEWLFYTTSRILLTSVEAANIICGIDAIHITRQEINLATDSSQTNVNSSKTNVNSNLCLLRRANFAWADLLQCAMFLAAQLLQDTGICCHLLQEAGICCRRLGLAANCCRSSYINVQFHHLCGNCIRVHHTSQTATFYW